MKLERKLQKDLETMLSQEELIWYQRSREEWIQSGDRNTWADHASTMIWKDRNMIDNLKNNDGNWIDDPIILENMVQDSYKQLF